MARKLARMTWAIVLTLLLLMLIFVRLQRREKARARRHEKVTTIQFRPYALRKKEPVR